MALPVNPIMGLAPLILPMDWPRPDRTGFVALPTPQPGRLVYPAGAEHYADASDFVLRVRPRRDAPPILPLSLHEDTRVLVLGTTAGAAPDRWYDVRVEQPALSGLEGWIGHGEVALDAGASAAAAPQAVSAPRKHASGGLGVGRPQHLTVVRR